MSYTEQEQANLEAIKAWEAAYAEGPTRFMEQYCDDFLIELPLQGYTLNNKEDFIRGESAMQQLFTESGIKIEWMTVKDDVASVKLLLWGVKESGERYEQRMLSLLTMRDGKVLNDTTYCVMVPGIDQLEIMG